MNAHVRRRILPFSTPGYRFRPTQQNDVGITAAVDAVMLRQLQIIIHARCTYNN